MTTFKIGQEIDFKEEIEAKRKREEKRGGGKGLEIISVDEFLNSGYRCKVIDIHNAFDIYEKLVKVHVIEISRNKGEILNLTDDNVEKLCSYIEISSFFNAPYLCGSVLTKKELIILCCISSYMKTSCTMFYYARPEIRNNKIILYYTTPHNMEFELYHIICTLIELVVDESNMNYSMAKINNVMRVAGGWPSHLRYSDLMNKSYRERYRHSNLVDRDFDKKFPLVW